MSSFVFVILLNLIFCGIYFFLTWLCIRGLKTLFGGRKKIILYYIIFNIVVFITGILPLYTMGRLQGTWERIHLYFFGLFIALFIFELTFSVVLFGEDIVRACIYLFRSAKRKTRATELNPAPVQKKWVSRRKFVSYAGLTLAALPFTGLIYGMIKGKYNLQIRKETVYFDELPAAFDGFTITQFSDLHIGSFDGFARNYLNHVATELQNLNSDIIFFTGDVVNSRASEMEGWFEVFDHLSAPYGKYSILGNHDYGDYAHWPSDDAKKENFQNVKDIHPKIGFKLLLNEHFAIEKDSTKIIIAGVENWGKGHFPKFGDIKKATDGTAPDDFKILLSHDPSYWDEQILKEPIPCSLTLSGHTHGFQMGVEIPGFRWSPSQYVYKEWAGIYQNGKNYMYVNRGLGTIGYPGRAGIWPEITQITLKRNSA